MRTSGLVGIFSVEDSTISRFTPFKLKSYHLRLFLLYSFMMQLSQLQLNGEKMISRILKMLIVFFLVLSNLGCKENSTESGKGKIPEDNLIAFYPFNGNAGDESGNENHCILYGCELTENRIGIANAALRLDGVDNYIDFGGISIPDSSSITITQWFKIGSEERTHTYMLVNDYSPSSGEWGIFIGIRPEGIIQSAAGAGGNNHLLRAESTTTISVDKWNFIAVVFDDMNKLLQLYINGVLSAENTPTQPENEWTENDHLRHNWAIYPLLMGRISASLVNPTVKTEYFKGTIDDIRIYNRVLDKDEINILLNQLD